MWLRLGIADALVGAGLIWLLQGLRVLPGSFMTGSPTWAVLGVMAVGLGVFVQVRLLGERAGRGPGVSTPGRSGSGSKPRRGPARKVRPRRQAR